MEFNPEIKDILKEFKIGQDNGLLCLLAYYYGLDPDGIVPEQVYKAINLTKIVEKQHNNNTLVWNIPLFMGQETAFEWVKEWNNKWNVNMDRKAGTSVVTKRMKEFFMKYPQYRQQDVTRATELYFSKTDTKFLKNSAAFIFDGAGGSKNSILLGWCERIKTGESGTNMKGNLIT